MEKVCKKVEVWKRLLQRIVKEECGKSVETSVEMRVWKSEKSVWEKCVKE